MVSLLHQLSCTIYCRDASKDSDIWVGFNPLAVDDSTQRKGTSRHHVFADYNGVSLVKNNRQLNHTHNRLGRETDTYPR